MSKKTIKIPYNKIKNIVKESIRKVICENVKYHIDDNNLPIIDIDILRKFSIDYRLIPQSTHYGDVLSSLPYLKEAYGDIVEPDETVEKLRKHYHLNPSLVNKIESPNEIYIYVIVADIAVNIDLIIKDMEKLGYFLSLRRSYATVDNIEFVSLQFEPSCKLQNNETENIKGAYEFLYHWTPTINVDSILKNGLIPCHGNNFFNYPNRIYLIKGDSNKNEIKFLGWSISCSSNEKDYTLLKIDIKNIGNDVNFYLDPNSQVGIYTEDVIPAECIKIEGNITFPTLGGK